MGKGLAGFGFSFALLVSGAITAPGEERPEPANSILAAGGHIPASVGEMLPAHVQRGVPAAEWVRMNSDADSRTATMLSMQGYMAAEVDGRFADTYRQLEERGDLFAPQPSSNRFVRATDAIFKPAPIRIGTTFVSFTPVTAWKKRNPLCLLNPLVINISW